MTIGVDVSKDSLVHSTQDGHPSSVANSAKGVKQFLATIAPGCTIAMEATGRYHRLLADTAYARGFVVIVLNPKDVNRYAKSVSPRAATDPIAARIIAEFASIRKHRAYTPAPVFVDTLKNLVRTRAGLVKQRVGLQNQSCEHSDIASYLKQVIASINQSIAELEKQIVEEAENLPQYQLLVHVPGFGALTSAYITAMLASGAFRGSDSFVAFLGLDLRVRESGKSKGKRRLSKRGDPEARRLLYLAAFAASRHLGPFAELRLHYLARGFSKTEAAVFVARKLARVAWAICHNNEPYRADRVLNQTVAQNNTATVSLTQNSFPPTHVVALARLPIPERLHNYTTLKEKQSLDNTT
jgi:transposase